MAGSGLNGAASAPQYVRFALNATSKKTSAIQLLYNQTRLRIIYLSALEHAKSLPPHRPERNMNRPGTHHDVQKSAKTRQKYACAEDAISISTVPTRVGKPCKWKERRHKEVMQSTSRACAVLRDVTKVKVGGANESDASALVLWRSASKRDSALCTCLVEVRGGGPSSHLRISLRLLHGSSGPQCIQT